MARRYKQGQARTQEALLPPRVEDYVSETNLVWAIDAYVDTLDLPELGFTNSGGDLPPDQPAFDPGMLLKLYLYGYLNRVRSSRRLERECRRNLELMWLLEGLVPSYRTIAEFRRVNGNALGAANRDFVMLCQELDLLGGETIAIGGFFFHVSASDASITTKKSLGRQCNVVSSPMLGSVSTRSSDFRGRQIVRETAYNRSEFSFPKS